MAETQASVVPLPRAKPRVVLTDESGRSKTLDSNTGIQSIKGGQVIDANFFDSVMVAYSNMVNSPIAAITMIVLIFAAFSEYNSSDGPLELLLMTVKAASSASDVPVVIRNLCLFLVYFLQILVNNKYRVISVGLGWVPYIAKPSTNNMKLSIAFTAFVLLRPPKDLFNDVILSQIYFLWSQIRTPRYRFILMVIAIVFFVLGTSHLAGSIKKSRKSGGGSVGVDSIATDAKPSGDDPSVITPEEVVPSNPDPFAPKPHIRHGHRKHIKKTIEFSTPPPERTDTSLPERP